MRVGRQKSGLPHRRRLATATRPYFTRFFTRRITAKPTTTRGQPHVSARRRPQQPPPLLQRGTQSFGVASDGRSMLGGLARALAPRRAHFGYFPHILRFSGASPEALLQQVFGGDDLALCRLGNSEVNQFL